MTGLAEVIRAGGVRAARLPEASHVSIGLAIPAGFALDAAGAAGTAHLCEHAVLASLPHDVLGSLPIAAVTACHHTTFVADVLPDELDTALRVFAAIAQPDTTRLESAVRHERPVVALELSMAATATGRGLGAAVADRLVPDTGLGRELDATPVTVESVPYSEVLACVERHYTPQAATLVLAGPVTQAHLSRGLELFPGPSLNGAPAILLSAAPKADVAAAWGIAHSYPPRQSDPRPAWQDCMDEALTRPGSPADRYAKAQGATPFGAAIMRCPLGDLVLSAYRSPDPKTSGIEAASRLRQTMLSEEELQKTASAAARSAALIHATRRSRLRRPWHVRDALLADITGTGPRWEQWADPYDQALAEEAAAAALLRTQPWITPTPTTASPTTQ